MTQTLQFSVALIGLIVFGVIGFGSVYTFTPDIHSIDYMRVVSNSLLALMGTLCALFSCLELYMACKRDLKLGFSQFEARAIDRIVMVMVSLVSIGFSVFLFGCMFD